MPPTAFSNLDYLSALLRARYSFHHAHTMYYPLRYVTPDEVITTHRFILTLEGTSHYTVDGVTAAIEPGLMLFVPAWTRRIWQTNRRTRCRNIWCEFSDDGLERNLHTLFIHKPADPAVEYAALERMVKIWTGPRRLTPSTHEGSSGRPLTQQQQLQLEGELKALLSRFWPNAKPVNPAALDQPIEDQRIHPDLKRALRWLNDHFLEPHALQGLYKKITLSPNHFRFLFHRDLRSSPQGYLMRLRLRRARSLVVGSELSFKEIAAQTGFADPLFFSRQYRIFFGTSPSNDRKKPRA